MVKGADEDCKFLFTATENEQYGHFVTSIGGLEQDLEANKYWMIYVTDSPANPAHPPTDYDLSDFGKFLPLVTRSTKNRRAPFSTYLLTDFPSRQHSKDYINYLKCLNCFDKFVYYVNLLPQLR